MKPMITILFLCLTGLIACTDSGQKQVGGEASSSNNDKILGAWEVSYMYNDSVPSSIIAIISKNYISKIAYSVNPNMFHWTAGGQWDINDNGEFLMTYEYNTEDSSKVGDTDVMSLRVNQDSLFLGQDNVVWKSLDKGLPGKLADAWIITARMRDGQMHERKPGVRKTMKILSGKRFQWIAYNTSTAEFYGTGGGTYTTMDGLYTENIDVFSRDSSRVGASLKFNYRLDSGLWHHSGVSSRGDSIYEIWTSRDYLK